MGSLEITRPRSPWEWWKARTQRLLQVTEQALYAGIAAARAGNRVSDISRAVQTMVEANGFSVVREFVGHGVGRKMHEDPQIPNYVVRGPTAEVEARE